MKHQGWVIAAAIVTIIGLPLIIMLNDHGFTNTMWMITAIITYVTGRGAQQARHLKQAAKEKP